MLHRAEKSMRIAFEFATSVSLQVCRYKCDHFYIVIFNITIFLSAVLILHIGHLVKWLPEMF